MLQQEETVTLKLFALIDCRVLVFFNFTTEYGNITADNIALSVAGDFDYAH